MSGEEIYLPVLQWVFMVSTAVLFLLTFLFFRRIRSLKGRVESVCAELSEKDKQLAKKDDIEKELLIPFGSTDSKSIIVSLNAAGELTYMNEAAEKLFGYTCQEILGQQVLGRIFPYPDPKNKSLNLIEKVFENPRLYLECETENIKKSGEKVFISWTNRVRYDKNGQAIELHGVGFDITRRKQLENNLVCLSKKDALTGVLNRQTFLEAGEKEKRRADLYKRPLSVLVMGLTYFHNPTSEAVASFSDRALQDVISLCQKSLRLADVIGRIDDVEFAVILPETDIEKAELLAEDIKKKIQEQSLLQSSDCFVSARFGVARSQKTDPSFDHVLVRAMEMTQQDKKMISKTATPSLKKKG